MSRPRFANLDQDRRDKLLDTAAEEFLSRGYEAASLNRILERSGMSKSSLYYYFDDKADLFSTLVERGVALLIARLGHFEPENLTTDSFWPELLVLYDRSMALTAGEGWLFRLSKLFFRLRDQPQPTDPTSRVMKAVRGWTATVILRGQTLGVIRDDLPLPLLIDCTMSLGEALDRWAVAHLDGLDDAARRRLVSENLDLLRRLLAP
jgi:AcrR family transcriptional regulator